jgi:hypothetical protein
MEECVDDCACMQQIPHRAEMEVRVRCGRCTLQRRTEVGPLGWYEGATSIGQNQHQMQFALKTPYPKDRQCLPLKWMMWASDGDMLGQVFEVGSVL